MRFFHFCRWNSCDKYVDPVQLKVQEKVDTVVQPCDGKRNTSSTGKDGIECSRIAAKIRFELDIPNDNALDFPISMVGYLDKYINIHIPDKDIREKVLKDNSVPKNVKEP